MIKAFLEDFLQESIRGKKILDIGCGNGQISDYFSIKNDVFSVDVDDKRSKKDHKYHFQLVKNEKLPFDNQQFDIIISHHVIEHLEDQNLHLLEIIRTLKPSGVIYIGCPNKSSPFMAGHIGNTQVLKLKGLIELFHQHQLECFDYYGKLLKEPQKYYCETKIGQYIPLAIIELFKNWYPSQCFILKRS